MRQFAVLLLLASLSCEVSSPSSSRQVLSFIPEARARWELRAPLTPHADGFALPRLHQRGLAGRLPRSAAEPFVLNDSEHSAGALTFQLAGARPAPATALDDEVVWTEAYPGVDVSAFASAGALELSYLFRRSPRRVTWRFSLPPGASWRTEATGRLLLERDGEALFAVPRPVAVDAVGSPLAVRTEVEGDSMHFEVVGAPNAFPVLLDPVVEVPLWRFRDQADPFPRASPGAAYDAVRQQTVLFGGRTRNGLSNQTWTFDGARWTLRAPANAPSARSEPSMVFDAARGHIVLFGGTINGLDLRDTWLWDGTDWTLASTSAPNAGSIGMTYDSDRQLVIGHAGFTTWWDGGSWAVAPVSGSAPALKRTALAYDPTRSVVLLFGGEVGSVPQNQTWELVDGGWFQRTSATTPRARVGHGMEFDPRRGRVVLVGGSPFSAPYVEAWEWTGVDWRALATPPVLDRFRLVDDPVRSRLQSIGGSFSDSEVMWEELLDGGWVQVASGAPSSKTGFALAYDSLRGVSVLAGGARTGVSSSEAFVWDGGVWRPIAPLPTARARLGLAFDPSTGTTFAAGGTPAPPTGSAWDGTTWLAAPQPPNLMDQALTFSPADGLLSFGGIDATFNRYRTLHRRLDGGTWIPLSAGGPIETARSAIAFDTTRSAVVLFNQFSTGASVAEFTPDGGWQLFNAPGPAPSSGAMAWDVDRGRSVLFVGGALWEWDGQAWSRLNTVTAPLPDPEAALVYDDARHLFVLHTSEGQTWELTLRRTNGSDCSSSWQCASGSCVDGVCCNLPCGDGAQSDCLACSVAAGASVDGVCETFPAGRVCNPNPGVCLLPAFCTGSSTCPAPAPDSACVDAGVTDAGVTDAGVTDAGVTDAGVTDAGVADAGVADAGVTDAGVTDAGVADAGVADAGVTDAGVSTEDGGATDAGVATASQFAVGCGCGASSGAWPMALLLVNVAWRRARKRTRVHR